MREKEYLKNAKAISIVMPPKGEWQRIEMFKRRYVLPEDESKFESALQSIRDGRSKLLEILLKGRL